MRVVVRVREHRRGPGGAEGCEHPSLAGGRGVTRVDYDEPLDRARLPEGGSETAVAAGVRRILYTSHQSVGLDSPFYPARVHAATEALLADSGVAWTSLRNGFYAHSLDWLLGPWRETRIIAAPADGPVSWTERGDEAEAAAVILAGQQPFDGPSRSPRTPPLRSTTSRAWHRSSPAVTSGASS
jgi:NAD(P)H dehydrogenase (quinone)